MSELFDIDRLAGNGWPEVFQMYRLEISIAVAGIVAFLAWCLLRQKPGQELPDRDDGKAS